MEKKNKFDGEACGKCVSASGEPHAIKCDHVFTLAQLAICQLFQ